MTLAAVAVAVLAGAVLQSATGFGFALVSAPVLFAVFTPGEALTILILLAGALSALVLFSEARELAVRRRDVRRLILWALPGLAVGVLVLRAVDKPVLQVGVGLAVVTAALLEARRAASPDTAAKPWPAAPVGLVSGALATTTGVNGPPMVMYFLRSGADQHEMRDSLSAVFLLYVPLSVAALAVAGQLGLSDVEPIELAGLLVLVLLGRPLGRALFLRLSEDAFRTAGIALALLAGVGSLVAGLAG